MTCLDLLTTVHYCNCMTWYQVISAWLINRPDCIRWMVQTMNFLIVKPSPHSHPPWAQIFAAGSCFQISLACVSPLMYETMLHIEFKVNNSPRLLHSLNLQCLFVNIIIWHSPGVPPMNKQIRGVFLYFTKSV